MNEKMKRVGLIITDELVARAKVAVLEGEIADGNSRSETCVVALALKEQYDLDARVGSNAVYPESRDVYYPLSDKLIGVVGAFDMDDEVPTGVFPLDLPARLVSK